MSDWIVPKVEDLVVAREQIRGETEVHILIENDENGNRYVSLEGETLEYLRKVLLGTNAK